MTSDQHFKLMVATLTAGLLATGKAGKWVFEDAVAQATEIANLINQHVKPTR